MSTTRYFSGGRDPGKRSVASELMRLEISKKGKMPTAARYKYIMKKKLAENHKTANLANKSVGFKLPGSLGQARQMSKKAEEALKQVAMKKAAKEAKKMRKMVIVQPKTYSTGILTRKGKIQDIAGNTIGEVNVKNGKMTAGNGWNIGRYKPKSMMTNIAIQDAINKYSPYYINLRKMQAMQQAHGVHGAGDDVINVWGRGGAGQAGSTHYSGGHGKSEQEAFYGSDMGGPRQNIGVTAWGATSDNIWGTFADNAWGNSMDNVWGGNSSDVWGGIGAPSWWGYKGPHVWGTGSGKNYIHKLTSGIMAIFGFSLKRNRETVKALRGLAVAHEHSNSSRTAAHEHSQVRTAGHEHAASAPRSAPATRAPTTTRK